MNCENYKDKIIAYIDNELNESDRISFEKELKNNSELNAEYTEMKDLLNSLKNLPEIKTSKNFMISLNFNSLFSTSTSHFKQHPPYIPLHPLILLNLDQ